MAVAFLFDLDKTLTQCSRHTYYRSWQRALEILLERRVPKLEFEAVAASCIRGSWDRVIGNLFTHYRAEKELHTEHFLKVIEKIFLSWVWLGAVKVKPGMKKLLKLIGERDDETGICTNASAGYAWEVLKILSLYRYFPPENIIDCESSRWEWIRHGYTTNEEREGCRYKQVPVPWCLLIKKMRLADSDRVFVLEDRVMNAIGGVLAHPNATAFVFRHYDNTSETIPKAYRKRVRWVEHPDEVTDIVRKL